MQLFVFLYVVLLSVSQPCALSNESFDAFDHRFLLSFPSLVGSGPKPMWRKWAFSDIMADAYMRKRESKYPDLRAMAASCDFVCKAMGSLSQVRLCAVRSVLNAVLRCAFIERAAV